MPHLKLREEFRFANFPFCVARQLNLIKQTKEQITIAAIIRRLNEGFDCQYHWKGASPRAVRLAIKRLADVGLITVERRDLADAAGTTRATYDVRFDWTHPDVPELLTGRPGDDGRRLMGQLPPEPVTADR